MNRVDEGYEEVLTVDQEFFYAVQLKATLSRTAKGGKK